MESCLRGSADRKLKRGKPAAKLSDSARPWCMLFAMSALESALFIPPVLLQKREEKEKEKTREGGKQAENKKETEWNKPE